MKLFIVLVLSWDDLGYSMVWPFFWSPIYNWKNSGSAENWKSNPGLLVFCIIIENEIMGLHYNWKPNSKTKSSEFFAVGLITKVGVSCRSLWLLVMLVIVT